ncbi:metallophosphoesterase [Candidatus Ozemobacteraceae bacterium]|nr:metallophosphoesterase [Candidatus Ozemobacteraceae bacterium]
MNTFAFHSYATHLLFASLAIILFALLAKSRMRFSLFLFPLVFLAGGAAASSYTAQNSFHIMRDMAWLVFGYLPATLAVSAIYLARSREWAHAVSAALFAGFLWAVAWQGFIVEPGQLTVRRFQIATPKIRSKIRIAFMSDIQSDAFGDNERRVWRSLLAEKPDLILLGGDYTHDWSETVRQKVRLATREYLLKIGFKAPLGVLAIQGNVDTLPWNEMFAGTGVETVSSRSSLRFEGGLTVTLLGMKESFDTRLKVPPAEGFHLVLGHSPDYSLGQVSADLMLAGHTHGGQVRLPWFGPLITSSKLPRRVCDGESRFPDGRRLFVTRGAGLERKHAPRIRLLCPPEIVVVELVPSGSAGPAS